MPNDADVIHQAWSARAMTGLMTPDCAALRPPFEQEYESYNHTQTSDGQPRPSRRYPMYDTCPFPTMSDKLLGKKKRRLSPHLLSSAVAWRVGVVRMISAGKAQEKSLAAWAGDSGPAGSGLSQERRFLGVVLARVAMDHPQKTPRGGDRTDAELTTKHWLSPIRMGGVKRDRMVNGTIRRLKGGSRATIMDTCGGWHHFRPQYRP
jgi:hypothetical protein